MSEENIDQRAGKMDSPSVVQRIVDAVERRDAEALAALYTQDATVHHPLYAEPARGQDAICASQQELFNSISEIEIEVRSVLTDGNTCAAEVVIKATNTGPIDVGGAHSGNGEAD